MQTLCVCACVWLWAKLTLLLSCLQVTFGLINLLFPPPSAWVREEPGRKGGTSGAAATLRLEGSFSAFPLAWRPRSPRGRQRGRGFGSGRTRFGVWKDLVLVWKEVFGLEVPAAAVPLALVGVLDSVAEVKKLCPGSSRMVLVGL